MPKVSIIIPVYNCETYLLKCVQSILNQTEKDFELILVDDGSTDGSGEVCDRFSQMDSRVTVIHQQNAGVSAARNAGLAAAKGTFIGFVDADDFIDPKTYEIALSAMGDNDMVMWDAVTVTDDGRTEADTIPLLTSDCVLEATDWTPELLSFMAGAVWRCLYRQERIRNIRFPVGIKLSEDRLFNLFAIGSSKRLSYLKQGLYYRYVRSGSAVHRYHGDKFEKNLIAMEVAKEAIERHWDSNYIPVYTRMLIICGALEAVYEICSPEFPGKGRLGAIRSIAGHEAVSRAFVLCQPQGLREMLLKARMGFALLLVGVLYNCKNR